MSWDCRRLTQGTSESHDALQNVLYRLSFCTTLQPLGNVQVDECARTLLLRANVERQIPGRDTHPTPEHTCSGTCWDNS